MDTQTNYSFICFYTFKIISKQASSFTVCCQVTTLGKLFTHVCLCYREVQFGTSRGVAVFCGWEGNLRSGVALAMRHRLEWFIHLRAQGLSDGDDYPTNTPHGVWYSLCPVLEPGRKNRICSVSRPEFVRNDQIWLLSVILCYSIFV